MSNVCALSKTPLGMVTTGTIHTMGVLTVKESFFHRLESLEERLAAGTGRDTYTLIIHEIDGSTTERVFPAFPGDPPEVHIGYTRTWPPWRWPLPADDEL